MQTADTLSPNLRRLVQALVIAAVMPGPIHATSGAPASTALAGIDLVVACSQTAPPDPAFFVDGETITLECMVTNQGTLSSGRQTAAVAVFSVDSTVGSTDTFIAQATVPTLSAGAGAAIRLSAAPLFTVTGPRKICVKADVVAGDLDQQAGQITESNESNNEVCTDVTLLEARKDLIVAPGSVTVTPGPTDPANLRAGLPFELSYEILNQGVGAVRHGYTNHVRIGATSAAALADPNSVICSRPVSFATQNQYQPGGASVSLTHGIGDRSDPATCRIPFDTPVGTSVLVIQTDALAEIAEKFVTGSIAPAESNNTLAVPIQVEAPLDPRFHVQHTQGGANDQLVEITGPGTQSMFVGVSSARGLTGYAFRLSWAPPGLISVGDAAIPGGDPGQVVFTGFLETEGLAQSCAVSLLDNSAGFLDVICGTTDLSGSGSAASTENRAILLGVTFTAVSSGSGTLTITNPAATSGTGQPYAAPRVQDGTFIVGGAPDLAIINAVPPPQAYPGELFSVSYEIRNAGFAAAGVPLQTSLVISRDDVIDPIGPASPDLRACLFSESAALPPLSTVQRTLNGCSISQDFRPGLYNGFFMEGVSASPINPTIAEIPFLPRIVALRSAGNGRVAESLRAPESPGAPSGPELARSERYRAREIVSVKSEARNLNWLVRLLRAGDGERRLDVMSLPQGVQRGQRVLTSLRLPGESRRLLGAADIDGDGDDELILLRRERRGPEGLDFRRIDFVERRPIVCQSAAISGALPGSIIAATGIQYDTDAEDEVAILTEEGGLTIYDLTLTGSLPPAAPCKTVPVLIEAPAAAALTPLADDGLFGTGGRVLSLCALDLHLDLVEEFGILEDHGGRDQSLKIFEAPAGPGGSAILIADDPAFGAASGRGRARSIACTR